MVYRSSKRGGSSDDERSSPTNQRTLNVFRNDGSFLEMFKKMQEKQQKDKADQKEDPSTDPNSTRNPVTPSSSSSSSVLTSGLAPKHTFVGKRRGGRVLPTGKVKKPKVETDSDEPSAKDAWSVYLEEVKRYKETTCEEDGKTRPLVK